MFRIVGFVIIVSDVNLCTSTERSGEIIFGTLVMRAAVQLPILGIFFVAELTPCALHSGCVSCEGAGL
jgi:hypothetical protein